MCSPLAIYASYTALEKMRAIFWKKTEKMAKTVGLQLVDNKGIGGILFFSSFSHLIPLFFLPWGCPSRYGGNKKKEGVPKVSVGDFGDTLALEV